MKKVLAILLALIMVFTLVACTIEGEPEDSKTAEDAAPAADAEATPDAEEEKAEDASSKPEATASSEDIFVGISINALDAINNQQTFEMMQEKCKAAGFEYSATNANGDAVQQSTDIENLVQMGCNYIVVLNGDTDGLTGAVQEAVSKGVKVISVESGYIDGISAYFAKNDFALGSAMYMMLASEMGYQGKIICTGHTGHPAIRARVDDGKIEFTAELK